MFFNLIDGGESQQKGKKGGQKGQSTIQHLRPVIIDLEKSTRDHLELFRLEGKGVTVSPIFKASKQQKEKLGHNARCKKKRKKRSKDRTTRLERSKIEELLFDRRQIQSVHPSQEAHPTKSWGGANETKRKGDITITSFVPVISL